ncbi:hypothetical protein Dred_1384 [Desulforamulus reducens MI-1]|uniref:DUF3794 domain-containing protein n=1 Tax=Desulforamulus reducens (strain ATCC BAA-1160 / DSM 100696 / MI-1) TaxID=349161 RepID=A4J4B1_DESRM|nr:hypothetical protein [Desulforamulus reducens]ABO49914.1 hypothetical protein Dred_1384 [Desulforamulus reducens MI-1]
MSEFKCGSKPARVCVDVTCGTQSDCVSNSVLITALSTGTIAKIPVTLAEFTVQVNIDSFITLPEPALEIKDIKKRVKVTQCLLLQPTNVLFLEGFIRKNIDYSTRTCSNAEGVCGDIRHCTVDVPFKCTTTVPFNSGVMPEDIRFNSTNEFEYFKRQNLPREFAEKDKLLSGDFSEFNQISEEFFNELPYCELISARIVEFDEFLNRRRLHGEKLPFEERLFRRFEEKAVLNITLKILQNRQVCIPPTTCNVRGQVADHYGTGVSGVTMTFTIEPGQQLPCGTIPLPSSVTTNAGGFYNQMGFANGITYKVTPSKANCTFDPPFRTFQCPAILNFEAQCRG